MFTVQISFSDHGPSLEQNYATIPRVGDTIDAVDVYDGELMDDEMRLFIVERVHILTKSHPDFSDRVDAILTAREIKDKDSDESIFSDDEPLFADFERTAQ